MAKCKARKTKKLRNITPKQIVARVAYLLVLLIVCAAPVFFVSSPISYIPLVAVVIAIVLSYVYLRIIMRHLSYSEDSLLDSCERCSEIEFVVNFHNTSILPVVRIEPYFYISDLFGETDTITPATMPLMPREERDFRFKAGFDHLGTYSAGVKKIVVSDLFGLFSHTIQNNKRHEVRVLPRAFDTSRVGLSEAAQESQSASQPIVTEDLDYAGVREYVPGDPLKTIHWKLSSRNTEGNYYTRLYETFGNPGLSVIIDHSSPQYDSESLMQVFDGLLESAISLAIFSRKMGVDAGVIYKDSFGNDKTTRVLNLDDSSTLIEDVPRVTVGEGGEARELLGREIRSNQGQTNLAYCTAHVDQDTIAMLLDAKMRKRNPILFVVVPKLMERQERADFLRPLQRLEAAQIPYYVVSDAQELGAGEEEAQHE